jgi:hypothetical protein
VSEIEAATPSLTVRRKKSRGDGFAKSKDGKIPVLNRPSFDKMAEGKRNGGIVREEDAKRAEVF